MALIERPQEMFTSPKVCGDHIVSLTERKSKLQAVIDEIDEEITIAKNAMLDQLAASGLKSFDIVGVGKFTQTTSDKVGFPTAENGGKETAVKWLEECLERGVITPAQILDIQQARLNLEPVLAVEEAVRQYNEQLKLHGSTDLIPDSPFHHFRQTTLSSPRTRKTK